MNFRHDILFNNELKRIELVVTREDGKQFATFLTEAAIKDPYHLCGFLDKLITTIKETTMSTYTEINMEDAPTLVPELVLPEFLDRSGDVIETSEEASVELVQIDEMVDA